MKTTFCRCFLLGILFSVISVTSPAQVIPDSVRVDWSYAGVQSWYLDTGNVANVKNFGAVGNGTTNDQSAIMSAINSLAGRSGIVFFPAGNYRINSTLTLPDSVTLKGEGAALTTLTFNFSGGSANCINIQKSQSGSFVSVDSGYRKNSTVIYTDFASSFIKGDYAEIRQSNGSWDAVPIVWADHSVGQVVKIDSVNGNALHLEHALRIDYSANLNVQVRKVNPRTNVGIECLKLYRADGTATGVNFMVYFNYAANCRMRDVESDHSIGAHAWADISTALEITGCYFHDAWKYDGTSTNGYGVGLAAHSGECRIENNIFKHLRHSMMVKQGANGNVFAYNYSIDPNRTEFPYNGGSDISVHGHYPFANLFEGNICQTLFIDTIWGPAGPYNTYFRNRIELYGILMFPASVNSNRQNFVGNDITGGLYFLAGSGHFTYGNNVLGTINPPGTTALPDSSYYLSTKPSFWNIAAPWPTIGTPHNVTQETIPALERYIANDFTACEGDFTTGIPAAMKNEGIAVYPNPFTNELNISFADPDEKAIVQVYDVTGKMAMQKTYHESGSGNMLIKTDGLCSGFYYILITGDFIQGTFTGVKVNSDF